jgi:hypothetical protein
MLVLKKHRLEWKRKLDRSASNGQELIKKLGRAGCITKDEVDLRRGTGKTKLRILLGKVARAATCAVLQFESDRMSF